MGWLQPEEDGWERMTEGLQRVASRQTARVFSECFVPIYSHLFQTMYLNALELRRFGREFEVRHCGTALPHNRTALSEESFVVALGAHGTWCRDRKRRRLRQEIQVTLRSTEVNRQELQELAVVPFQFNPVAGV